MGSLELGGLRLGGTGVHRYRGGGTEGSMRWWTSAETGAYRSHLESGRDQTIGTEPRTCEIPPNKEERHGSTLWPKCDRSVRGKDSPGCYNS